MRVIVFCTLEFGLLPIKYALDRGIKITKVIGLNPASVTNLDFVSGFVDVANFCKKHQINFDYVDDYSLEGEDPLYFCADADLLWVTGWQRLLPKTFLEATKFGAVGAHGSCDGITKGRGRSPQNWALIIGAKKFEISLFKITPGIDEGPILGTSIFELNEKDTIFTSYVKANLCIAEIFCTFALSNQMFNAKKQTNKNPEYFPKRTVEDGFIDWTMDYRDISNQVNALSNPYPNARTIYASKPLKMQNATPIAKNHSFSFGEIVFVHRDGSILVAAEGGFVLIEKIEFIDAAETIKTSKVFQSKSMQNTINSIVLRFYREFPDKQLNATLTRFWLSRGFSIPEISEAD